jgi:hypothetical protein
MRRDLLSYVTNPIMERLWKMGYEEVVDPLGPLRAALHQTPQPEPWKVAAPQLVQAAIAKDLATKQQNKAGQHSATQTIDTILDDWCGTPPRRHPWPFPGPPPWAWEIAAELSLFANTLQSGSLRTEIESIVGKIGRGGESR